MLEALEVLNGGFRIERARYNKRAPFLFSKTLKTSVLKSLKADMGPTRRPTGNPVFKHEKGMTKSLTLPARRSLGDLAELKPVVLIDSGKQTPLPITRLPCITGALLTGDYSIAGLEHLFSVERKSVADLVSCCCASSRERFEHELHRLRGFRFKRLLVVGLRAEIEQGRYRSNIRPASVLGSLAAWECRVELPLRPRARENMQFHVVGH